MSAPRRQPQKPEFTTHPANGLAGRPLQSRICPQKVKEMLVSTSPRKNVKFPVHPVHSVHPAHRTCATSAPKVRSSARKLLVLADLPGLPPQSSESTMARAI